MKTLKFLGMTLLMVLLAVNFTACSDDENEPNSPLLVHGKVEKSDLNSKKFLYLTTMERGNGMKIHSIIRSIPIKS